MPLYTSSSKERLPKGRWGLVWGLVLLFCCGSVFYCEYAIRHKGYVPSVIDSVQLWVAERQKASQLGERALILVGGSRAQLGMDMVTLKEMTPLLPIQLAIDANLSYPVLQDLADDQTITGTLLVALYEGTLQPPTESRASKWVHFYQQNKNRYIEPYRRLDDCIRHGLEEVLVTKLEGAKPSLVIPSLLFRKNAMKGNYLTTNPDRSRDADYSKVEMPLFYARRVFRHLGSHVEAEQSHSWEEFFAYHEKIIAETPAADNKIFLEQLEEVIGFAKKIEQRGGTVVFIRFPTAKLPLKYDMQSFPYELFWKKFAEKYPKTIHFLDYPALSKFDLPDGSHLDMRDKKEFTTELVSIVQKKGWLPAK